MAKPVLSPCPWKRHCVLFLLVRSVMADDGRFVTDDHFLFSFFFSFFTRESACSSSFLFVFQFQFLWFLLLIFIFGPLRKVFYVFNLVLKLQFVIYFFFYSLLILLIFDFFSLALSLKFYWFSISSFNQNLCFFFQFSPHSFDFFFLLL
jgi:hypothetical protein